MEKEGESNSCCDKSLTRKPNAIDVRVGMSVRQRRLLLASLLLRLVVRVPGTERETHAWLGRRR